MGSVHFRLVPWSGLYFSRSIGPFLCSRYYRQGFNLLPVVSKAVPSVIASSVCWSLQCLISALIQRGRWWILFFFKAHLFSRAVGKEGCCKEHWRVLAVPQPHWSCPYSRHVYPPCPHCSGSRLLHQEPPEAGPGLHAPPRSKPLRFRHSGSPQRLTLG